MNLFWRKESNAKTQDYINRIESTKKKLDKSQLNLFDLLMKRFCQSNYEVDVWFSQLIQAGEIKEIAQLFEKDRYPVLVHLLGEEYAGKYVAWLQKMAAIPYTLGYYRRPQRSTHAKLHYTTALNTLRDFLAIVASGLPLEVILEGGRDGDEQTFIDDINFEALLSIEIDAGNRQVIDKVKDIICGDNNAGRISYDLLRGIVIASNRELYELEGKLLLAARLQEGLRQSIAETMDSGTTEAFLYLFDIIRRNDLQRYSAIKRAVGTWTGLVSEADADRINTKIMDLIHLVLTDPEYAESCLCSEDAIEVYLGLWAKGFYNIEDLVVAAHRIMEEGVKHKVQVLFIYVEATQCDWLREALAKTAVERFHDEPGIVAALLPSYLHSVYLRSYYGRKEERSYFSSDEEACRHYELWKDIARRLTKKQTFSPFVFPWLSKELTRREVMEKMALIVYVTGNQQLLDDLCLSLDQLDSDVRTGILREMLTSPASPVQLEAVVKALGDRAEYPRKQSYEILSKMPADTLPYSQIKELLKYKTGNLRQQAISLLLRQQPEGLQLSVEHLLTAPLLEKRMAALDILLTIRKQPEYADVCRHCFPLIRAIKAPSDKEKILIDQLIGEDDPQIKYAKENVFGLCEEESAGKDSSVVLPLPPVDEDFDVKKAFPLLQEGSFLKKIFGKPQEKIYTILQRLSDLVASHAHYEYATRYNDKVLLGDYFWEISGVEENAPKLDHYPLASEWRAFYAEEIQDFQTLLQINFAISVAWGNLNRYGDAEPCKVKFTPVLKNFYGFDLPDFFGWRQNLPYHATVERILNLLAEEYEDKAYVQVLLKNLLSCFCSILTKDNFKCVYPKKVYGKKEEMHVAFLFHDERIGIWLRYDFPEMNDEAFASYFAIRHYLYRFANYFEYPEKCVSSEKYLSILAFAKAYELGIIPESEVIRELTIRVNAGDSLETATRYLNHTLPGWRQRLFAGYDQQDFSRFKQVIEKVTRRIVEIELKRGDSVTEVSPLAMSIDRIEGVDYLIGLLQAFGKDTFGRSGYSYNSSYTKKEVLSKLLRVCYPAPEDTSERLSERLKNTGITEQRLVEAAMYAPQWLEIIEGCIGWKGLTSAAYYFHAHTNEWCDDKKKAIIARYTPIDPEDLKAGAFDIDWFREAYEEVGSERFQVIYEAAKYISSGASHTRARKYADAVNGKLIAADVKKQIQEKRNKDLLMSYCLIPLDTKKRKDLLERYQYLQQFLKESKAFGAQRQESEKKAVEIGMQNLARNAGYADVTRLTWAMETELIKEMEPYLTPCNLEGVEVYVAIDEGGKAEMKYIKAGKTLNNVPAKLKKHPYIGELKEVYTKLKNQYARSRLMLEQAMEDRTPFYIRELTALSQNPVVWPLLKYLVFISEEDTGFFADGGLVTADGEFFPQAPDTQVRIAHPADLYQRHLWTGYQRYLFDHSIRQPFKQVFRELYVKTEDELPMQHSLRYAGNQIQPQKTVAVLKSRRWVADYEEGLQKVYYKENIVANIYALADWFSPADIEAPTLEWVAFSDRKTYKPLKIEEIPDIIFSEVMRDVDLAVSVAHAGGVDPEASHSTVEMRRAILAFTLPLFKLTNVTLEGNHAFIKGSMGDYHIHLGSGVIHQEGGVAIAVLPVHSQHRGRLFLPFVDDDPKTAEVISKVLLFADDTKIKDPFILDQIRKR